MEKQYRILVINPGSTSTKIAVYEDQSPILEKTLRHAAEELTLYGDVVGQFSFRRDLVLEALAEQGLGLESLDAVIGRGGLVKPIPSGVYGVNEALVKDLREESYGTHASNLGGLIADEIGRKAGIPAYIADPVVVDELQPIARVSGIPQIERVSIFHALNQKAVARQYALSQGLVYEDLNLIVAHMGGGISVGAHRKGRVIDVNNALDGEGPFSPERAGTVPAGQLAKLCFSGQYGLTAILKIITGQGGLVAHLGTTDVREVIAKARNEPGGRAALVLDAMCYNIAKSIGAQAAVLEGKVDAVILTGGIAYNDYVCERIERMTSFIARVEVIPGENEMEALAANALAALKGKLIPLNYE